MSRTTPPQRKRSPLSRRRTPSRPRIPVSAHRFRRRSPGNARARRHPRRRIPAPRYGGIPTARGCTPGTFSPPRIPISRRSRRRTRGFFRTSSRRTDAPHDRLRVVGRYRGAQPRASGHVLRREALGRPARAPVSSSGEPRQLRTGSRTCSSSRGRRRRRRPPPGPPWSASTSASARAALPADRRVAERVALRRDRRHRRRRRERARQRRGEPRDTPPHRDSRRADVPRLRDVGGGGGERHDANANANADANKRLARRGGFAAPPRDSRTRDVRVLRV